MKRFLIVVTIAVSLASTLQAKDFKIRSASELTGLNLQPGDNVILTGGDWKDQHLVFQGKGTEQKPIVLTTEKPGKMKLAGNSTLKIDGEWLQAEGLLFQDGYSQKEDIVVFSEKSANSRLTNSAIIDFSNPDNKVDYRWVSLNGTRNRVDHCYFKGKTHQGVTLVVWLSEKPNYHQIDHNYFGPRPELGRNGGETIRIGTSTWSFHDSFTTVENNVFEHCDGELEAISNKSCKNTLRNNLFYECKATLTLRHGNNSEVYGNYFIGNNKPGTGGIRLIGENHKVYDNHMQELSGTSVSAALSVMAGLPNPVLTSHWQVKNASITGNTIINCKESFAIGAGYNPQRCLPALNTVFANNVIVTKEEPLKWYDDKVDINFSNNTVWGIPSAAKLPEGFSMKDPQLKKDNNGLYALEGKMVSPFWKSEKIGPQWLDLKI
ncbi:polysaccharide lyase 6 family protein [Desertivirga arenae]|uniref:polysaccharide lyase 6 family protein n=1 Tax=Desertivirga arenae TaxID=2810309 RepID=UPI001A961C08|nr:polysaccharide lyase 6 family protein [Pedobacter sp. SYSU D00823]